MLVLTFHRSDTAKITVPPSDKPTEVVVMLCSTYPRVQLGFQAPREVEVLRPGAIDRRPKPGTERVKRNWLLAHGRRLNGVAGI